METFYKLFLPIAIIIAGIAVAFSVYYTGVHPKPAQKAVTATSTASGTVAPVTDADHIRGDKNAKLVIVEYSDTECPYCKDYYKSIKQIYDQYASSTKVAWVYRSFPITEIHTKAPKEAEALECANELGGSAVFWAYTDMIYDITPSNDGLDPSQLGVIADKVDESRQAAVLAMGADSISTPYTVFVLKTATGKTETIPLVDSNGGSLGALPYDSLKAVVQKLINS